MKKIDGKNILILDLETSGLISNISKADEYWNNNIFDSCRIIEIGYYHNSNFNKDTNNIEIHNYVRKPSNFNNISEESVSIHNITLDYALNNGYTFSKILLHNLYDILNCIDIFISHNTKFDFNILLNELYIIKQFKTINRLINIKKNKNVICTCRVSGYKRLPYLYNNIFLKDPIISHRAGDDVKTLIEILLKKEFNNLENSCIIYNKID